VRNLPFVLQHPVEHAAQDALGRFPYGASLPRLDAK
jgi:hypothetical protein